MLHAVRTTKRTTKGKSMDTLHTEERVFETAEKLEVLLRIWEEILMIAQASYTLLVANRRNVEHCITGSVCNWPLFRKALLTLLTHPDQYIDENRFATPEQTLKLFFGQCLIFDRLPQAIIAWCRSHRRMYNLSSDFQRSLEMTSLGNTSSLDVPEPFPAFGVYLPIPIAWNTGGLSGEINFIFVDMLPDEIKIIGLESAQNCKRNFFAQSKKFRIIQAIKAQEAGFLKTILEQANQGSNLETPKIIFLNVGRSDRPIKEDMENTSFDLLTTIQEVAKHEEGEMPEHWRLILRIVIGLCLHLELARRADKSRSHAQDVSPAIKIGAWRRQPLSPAQQKLPLDEQSIVAKAAICSVDLTEPIGVEKQAYHERIRSVGLAIATRELSTHFRREHWRRLPGTSDDPQAPRCVHVRSAFINYHRPVSSESLTTTPSEPVAVT